MKEPVDQFGEPVAEHYDETSDAMFDPAVVDPAVDVLAELAAGGRALELGIGTGRIALPLAARGVEVHGIELSSAMVARLRAKPGGAGIPVTIGDFTSATAGEPGTFRLAYLVFNTIMNVTSQAGQVDVFRNVAAHLEPGGRFVIETMVPDLRRLPPGEQFVVFDVSDDHIGVDEYDVANQGLVSHHVQAVGGRTERSGPVSLRLAGRARPDGADRRHGPDRPLGGLGPGAVHEREPLARLGLAEAVAAA